MGALYIPNPVLAKTRRCLLLKRHQVKK